MPNKGKEESCRFGTYDVIYAKQNIKYIFIFLKRLVKHIYEND